MDEQKDLRPTHETAGQQFVRTIRPVGCALFLILGILVTVLCFTVGRDPIRGYEPPESMTYYAEEPEALVQELEEHVFPALPEYDMTAEVTDGGVTVAIDAEHFVVARAALLRYFDRELITYVEK